MYSVDEAGLHATWIRLLLDSVVTIKATSSPCGCFYRARKKINPNGTETWICWAWRKKAWVETNSSLLLLSWRLQKRWTQTHLRHMQWKEAVDQNQQDPQQPDITSKLALLRARGWTRERQRFLPTWIFNDSVTTNDNQPCPLNPLWLAVNFGCDAGWIFTFPHFWA